MFSHHFNLATFNKLVSYRKAMYHALEVTGWWGLGPGPKNRVKQETYRKSAQATVWPRWRGGDWAALELGLKDSGLMGSAGKGRIGSGTAWGFPALPQPGVCPGVYPYCRLTDEDKPQEYLCQ